MCAFSIPAVLFSITQSHIGLVYDTSADVPLLTYTLSLQPRTGPVQNQQLDQFIL